MQALRVQGRPHVTLLYVKHLARVLNEAGAAGGAPCTATTRNGPALLTRRARSALFPRRLRAGGSLRVLVLLAERPPVAAAVHGGRQPAALRGRVRVALAEWVRARPTPDQGLGWRLAVVILGSCVEALAASLLLQHPLARRMASRAGLKGDDGRSRLTTLRVRHARGAQDGAVHVSAGERRIRRAARPVCAGVPGCEGRPAALQPRRAAAHAAGRGRRAPRPPAPARRGGPERDAALPLREDR
eukprot:scaffold497_cov368-Prasinococcus_capsulatus_cf.AAC.7